MDLEDDSQEVVNVIHDNKNHKHKSHLILKIKAYMEGITEVKVVKVHRTTNQYVDALTNYSLSLQKSVLEFSDCPSFVLNLMLEDSSGIG